MDESIILYTQGIVSFPRYEEYKAQAEQIAEYLNGMELTEESVKECKRKLADARKVVKALEDRRIAVKKAVLVPYNALEAQVKVITGIIDSADSVLRGKVREMEEQEREQKRGELLTLWEQRIPLYTFPAYLSDPFDRWCRPEHLNKTYSLNKAESDMTEWMEQREQEVNTINTLPNREEILIEYLATLDLAYSITTGNNRITERNRVAEQAAGEETATFLIIGKSNINFAEMLMKQNNINYRRM